MSDDSLNLSKLQETIRFASLGAIMVRETDTLPITTNQQVKFPRSKKKRIRKKWANQSKNFRQVTTDALLIDPRGLTAIYGPDGGALTLLCSSRAIVALRNLVKEEGS